VSEVRETEFEHMSVSPSVAEDESPFDASNCRLAAGTQGTLGFQSADSEARWPILAVHAVPSSFTVSGMKALSQKFASVCISLQALDGRKPVACSCWL
jgi:hypothetical protein